MKILHVGGDDYAALSFEDAWGSGSLDVGDLWNQAVASEKPVSVNHAEGYFEVEALEFGEVDPDFIKFVKSEVIDYDAGKSSNFYVIED